MILRYNGPAKNPHPELSFTHDDMLWIGRAFIGEHGDIFDSEEFTVFVWTMVNRFVLHPGNKHWPTFKFMLRRFSQPVNPRWQRDGDLARKHAGSPMCSEARFRRREKICSLSLDDFPRELSDALFEEIFHGEIDHVWGFKHVNDRPQRPSNFAATSSRLRARFPWGRDVGGNWYFEDKVLRKGTVVIDQWV